MKYIVDAALCCGHGQCYATAPEAFAANDDGENSNIGLSVDVPPELEDAVLRGSKSCPEAAIKVFR